MLDNLNFILFKENMNPKPQPIVRYCNECLHKKSIHKYTKKGNNYTCQKENCNCKVKKSSFF
jgi:predicted nucleotidyltransferase